MLHHSYALVALCWRGRSSWLSVSSTADITECNAPRFSSATTLKETWPWPATGDSFEINQSPKGHDSDTIDQVIQRQECRRLALAVIASPVELTKNKEQLAGLVAGIAAGG